MLIARYCFNYKIFTPLKVILLCLSVCLFVESTAQVFNPIRYEIDHKRKLVETESPEMLLRSREFIRLDPTYYVGYYCEAMFRYERASDAKGFEQVIPSLLKARTLFETDYQYILTQAFESEESFSASRERLYDYVILTDKLMDCYSHIDRPDSVITVLEHYKTWNFVYDILGADNYIAWTYHRNRFYTSNQFAFLRNTIAENEEVALNYLKNSLLDINTKAQERSDLINYQMKLRSQMSVYHYMSIVYSYMKKADSARMYFDMMRPYNIFPYNNYGIFCLVNGDFEDAVSNFEESMYRESGDDRLKEPYYYMTLLNTMRAAPQNSIKPLTDIIKDNGVRPGWGWYHIGLGRVQLYNGELIESFKSLKKAETFKEIHIGTTLGESHYTFSTQLLLLLNIEQQKAYLKFEDPYYWIKPSKLAKLAEYNLQLYTTRVALFNQIGTNTERQDLYYRLFASESTVSFDEIYYLIKDYGQRFFIKNFENQAKTDDRPNLKKYFGLLQARLLIEKGNESKALDILNDLQTTSKRDDLSYERLFEARMYEALAKAYYADGETEKYVSARNRFYRIFPQLVPFSGLKMEFKLMMSGGDEPHATEVLDAIKKYDIGFVEEGVNAPIVSLNFSQKEVAKIGVNTTGYTSYEVSVSVTNSKGKTLIDEKKFGSKNPLELADLAVRHMFNIGALDADL